MLRHAWFLQLLSRRGRGRRGRGRRGRGRRGRGRTLRSEAKSSLVVRFTTPGTVAILAQGTNLGCCGNASLLINKGMVFASVHFVILHDEKKKQRVRQGMVVGESISKTKTNIRLWNC